MNWLDFIGQYDLIYGKPPSCWQDGFVMGNGSLGAVYYAPEALTFLINKTDVLDARTKTVKRIIPPAEAEEMIRNGATPEDFSEAEIAAGEPEGAGPKTCCKLELDIGMTGGASTRSALPAIHSSLSLSDATVNIAMDKHLCHPRLTSFVDARTNTFVFRADDISPIVSFRNRIFFSRPDDIAIGHPKVWMENDRVFMEMTIPESGSYVVGLQIVTRKTTGCAEWIGKRRAQHRPPETGAVRARVQGSYGLLEVQGNFDLFLSVVTSRESDNPLKTVNENLDKAVAAGFEALHSGHAEWWGEYWSQSRVDLGDADLNALFYRSLYALGSSYRAAPMSGLLGLCYGPTPGPIQYAPWNGDLHNDLNVQCPFFPVFTLNHGELFEAYRETYHSFLPEARRLAKEVFDADGAHFDMCYNALGRSMFQGVGKYRYALMGSYVALIHCQAWRYRQDVTELRERIYPFLKEILAFYQSVMKKDENGLYRLWPAHAIELDVMDCANPVQIFSMLKICLETAIEAAEVLDMDEARAKEWHDVLTNLPEYPRGVDHKQRTVVLDGEGIHPDHHVGQAGCLNPVYPCGEVHADSAPETLELYRRTMESVLEKTAQTSYADNGSSFYQCVWQCFFRAMTALRLGRSEEFWGQYLPMFMKAYVKPNGLCSHDACVVVEPEHSEKHIKNIPEEHLVDRDEKMPKAEAWMGHAGGSTPNSDAKRYSVSLIEASADYLTMMTETLLQSHGGVIRLFPAWPKDRDAAFENLVAEGDVLVSAEIKDGKVECVRLARGKHCRCTSVRVKFPWTGRIEGYEFEEDGKITIEEI